MNSIPVQLHLHFHCINEFDWLEYIYRLAGDQDNNVSDLKSIY